MARALCLPVVCGCIVGAPASSFGQTPPTTLQDISAPVAPVSRVQVPGFSALLKDTMQDFRHLPSDVSFKWLTIGATVAGLAHSADRTTSRSLSETRMLDGLLNPGKTLGGARFQLGGALATYAIGRVARAPSVALIGADLVEAQLVTQALTTALKVTARRTRPDGTQYSFPSGHSSVTFASATVLQRSLGWKAGIPAYAVATYVATSRIQERRHYLSDVAFGAAIGIMAGRTVTVGGGDTRFAVTPMAAPGGAGVSFAWVGRR